MIGFMIDLDGTIYKGKNVIPGAPEFIRELKKRNIPFLFLTNNSSSDREHYIKKLRGMGFDIGEKEILSSTAASVRYILKNFPGKKVFPLGTPPFVKEITSQGIEVTEDDPDLVLLAFDRSITYDKLNKAYHFIRDGAEFIATHPDDLCPTEDDYDIDIGPFIRLLQSMTGKTAIVTGKPNKMMVTIAAEMLNVDHKDLWMIGDRLYTDIKMACDSDISSILVLSGETSEDDIFDSDIKPTMVKNSVLNIINELDKMI